MVKLLKDLGKTPVPPNKANLNLVSSAPLQKLTFIHFLHFLYFFLPHLRKQCIKRTRRTA